MAGGSATKSIPGTDPYLSNDATAQESLGDIRFDLDGRTFRYHQCVSTVTRGQLVNHLGSTGIASARVCPTFATSQIKRPAGACAATSGITASYFGWFQIAGPVGALNTGSTYVRTATKVAAGNFLVQYGNRVCSIVVAGNEHLVFGVARATDSGSFLQGGYLFGIA